MRHPTVKWKLKSVSGYKPPPLRAPGSDEDRTIAYIGWLTGQAPTKQYRRSGATYLTEMTDEAAIARIEHQRDVASRYPNGVISEEHYDLLSFGDE